MGWFKKLKGDIVNAFVKGYELGFVWIINLLYKFDKGKDDDEDEDD